LQSFLATRGDEKARKGEAKETAVAKRWWKDGHHCHYYLAWTDFFACFGETASNKQ